MNQSAKNIFALWDQSTGEARIALQALANRPPEGFNLGFEDAGLHTRGSLDDLAARIWVMDRILVVPPPDEVLVAVAFETGIAVGLGKPIGILELTASGVLAYAINMLFGAALPETSFVSSPTKLREQLRQASFWYEIPLEESSEESSPLLVCPREGVGQDLRDVIGEARPRWRHPVPEDDPRALSRLAVKASQLLWVLVPDTNPRRPWGNVLAALAAGVFYGAAHRRARTRFQDIGDEPDLPPRLEVLRESKAPKVPLLGYRATTFEDLDQLGALMRGGRPEVGWPALTVQKIEILNFKNIPDLLLDLTPLSALSGDWTCIAGVNGSGKTAILQALTLALLGPTLSLQIGSEELRQMLRRTGMEIRDAEIRVTTLLGGESEVFSLSFSAGGLLAERLPEGSGNHNRLNQVVVVAYGSSRNLSRFREDRYDNLPVRARRQMTLFDSRARITNVELLLDEGQEDNPALGTLRWLIEAILGRELSRPPVATARDRLVLGQSGVEVEPIELPDGFRSTVAWLADLCAAWHEVTGSKTPTPPAEIRALVLLDEIDLHLHPSLQRTLVPRLREALPNVQFIVTTHSPLVLSSFDRNEIIALDGAGGVRKLDRDILGFSADQIYEWLMETKPHGLVIEEKLRVNDDPGLALYLEQSPDRDEEAAQAELEEMDRLMNELLGPNPR